MNIAVFGATGMLGAPVVRQLLADGHQIQALVRPASQAKLPVGAKAILGDLQDPDSIAQTLAGAEAVYLNLSVDPASREGDFQPEREGLQQIVEQAEAASIRVIGYLSSLVQRYQGMEGFDWWVLRLKEAAVARLQQSSVPSLLFCPSTFMENFDQGAYRQGKAIALAGKSQYPMHFIAAEDYARMVSAAFAQFDGKSRTYVVQGPEGYLADQAAQIFVQHYEKERMRIMRAPLGVLRFFGRFSPRLHYGAKIIEALNRYPERFEGEATWRELGKPRLTLAAYARSR